MSLVVIVIVIVIVIAREAIGKKQTKPSGYQNPKIP